MRTLHLVPGSGGTFYCQNCIRDHGLVRALRRAGHDAVMVPLYLPMFGGDAVAPTDAPIFFGGVNIYLRELAPLFRRAPRWLSRLLDSRWLLARAATREGTTSAADLGPMTLSMLRGLEGGQDDEYRRFLDWLATQEKFDIIHVSNALLLGFVPALRGAVDAPVVCSLQDEIPWVDAMRPPHDRLCWEAMTGLGRDVALFAATSRWYADRMAERMDIPPEKLAVVHPSIDPPAGGQDGPSVTPPTIGYLARLNDALGFGAVVEAFLRLKKEPALADLRLSATGGATPADRPRIATLQKRLASLGVAGDVKLDLEFQTTPAPDFFDDLSVLSVPVPEGEAFGLGLIEAMGRGIPVVQPALGSYPEVVNATGGGVLYDPADPDGLTEALRGLLTKPERLRELGRNGRAAVREQFTTERMAETMLAVYRTALERAGK